MLNLNGNLSRINNLLVTTITIIIIAGFITTLIIAGFIIIIIRD